MKKSFLKRVYYMLLYFATGSNDNPECLIDNLGCYYLLPSEKIQLIFELDKPISQCKSRQDFQKTLAAQSSPRPPSTFNSESAMAAISSFFAQMPSGGIIRLQSGNKLQLLS